MTDYKRCPTCGAICRVIAWNPSGMAANGTECLKPACDALVRELAKVDIWDPDILEIMGDVIDKAREIVEACDE